MLKVISNPPAEAPKMDENKAKALQAALSQIEKQFGKGSIMKLGDADVEKGIQVVSTGSLGLDMALGVGGLRRARGRNLRAESSGKTTLALQVISNVPKLAAPRLHRCRARARPAVRAAPGVDPRSCCSVAAPYNGEAGARDRRHVGASASVDCVVIDSGRGPHAQGRIEGEMGEPQMGLQAPS